jgi:hypothetical protein
MIVEILGSITCLIPLEDFESWTDIIADVDNLVFYSNETEQSCFVATEFLDDIWYSTELGEIMMDAGELNIVLREV